MISTSPTSRPSPLAGQWHGFDLGILRNGPAPDGERQAARADRSPQHSTLRPTIARLSTLAPEGSRAGRREGFFEVSQAALTVGVRGRVTPGAKSSLQFQRIVDP